jgi:5-aminolevulinate synthase
LKDEGRYRVFADIRRDRGRFPAAHHHSGGVTRPITVWCRPALGSASLRRARS